MSVYRRKYKTKGGESRQSRYFTIEVTRPDGTLHREYTKLTDRKSAVTREAQIRVGVERGTVGLVDPFKEHRSKALFSAPDPENPERKVLGLFEQYEDYLVQTMKRDEFYAYVIKVRLQRAASGAAWLVLSDVTVAGFQAWLKVAAVTKHKGRLPKAKTLNQYADAVRGFVGWCRQGGLCPDNPFAGFPKATVVDNNRYRRAGTPEEVEKLLAAASPYNARFYRFVLYAHIRQDTIKHLRWHHLHLAKSPAWGETPGEFTKSRKAEKFAVRASLAVELRAWKKQTGAGEEDLVFPAVPDIDQFRADLAKAGVPFADAKGLRRLDLHALGRKTAVRMYKRAGVSLEEASRALHHKDLKTTKKHYDDDEADQRLSDAVEKLPDFGSKGGK